LSWINGTLSSKSADGRRSLGVIIILLLTSITVMLPALCFGEILRGQDALIHTRWQVAFAPVFWSGDIFPRWLPDLNKGFGSPAFFIYPPLTQMLAAVTYPLAPSAEWTSFRIAVSVTFAIFVAALGAFLWLRTHTSDRSAMWGAIAYSVAPYHLFVDTYFRGAFAEVWSFAPIPFAMLAVDRLSGKAHSAFLSLVLSLSCAVLLHAPSVLINVPVVGLYAALIGWQQRSLRPLVLFATAGAIAMLLCGGYLGTALTQVNMIRSVELFGGRLVPTKWLIGGGTWPDIPIMIMINFIMVLQVVLAIVLFRNIATGQPRTSMWRLSFALALMTISVVMTTIISEPLWSLNSSLNRIQFPWRFLSIQAIAIAALCAYVGDQAGRSSTPRRQAAQRSVFFAIGSMLVVNVALYAFSIESGAASGKARAALVADNTEPFEYQLGDIDVLTRRFPDNASTAILSGTGDVRVKQWRPRLIELATSSEGEMRLAIRQFSYTGWQYAQNGGAARPADLLSIDEPVVVVSVPPGSHRTTITMPPTQQERAGWIASLAGVASLVISIAALRRGSPLSSQRTTLNGPADVLSE